MCFEVYMKFYEENLPQGYVEAKTVDATNKRTGIILNLAALALSAATFFALWYSFGMSWQTLTQQAKDVAVMLAATLCFVVCTLAYLVCHELVHGVFYKLFTKRKLTFGLTFTCAYCGVPDVFVYRTAALFAVIAPFALFSVLLILPVILVHSTIWRAAAVLLFALHVGGCVGDLYVFGLLLFRFKKGTLVRDTGPKQTLYVRQEI